MRQNINLYQAVLIDQPQPLQARQTAWILLGFIVLLALLSSFGYWQLQIQKKSLVDLQQQEANLTTVVAQLEKQFPPREKSSLLEAELRRTEQQLEGRKRLLAYFSNQKAVGNGVILGTLEGLAQHVQRGVWLKRIKLDGSGQNIRLDGSALRPEQVPAYLQFLGDKGVLSGQVFSRFKLTHLKEHTGAVDFSLESKPEGEQ